MAASTSSTMYRTWTVSPVTDRTLPSKSRLERDLGSAVDHAAEPRNDVQHTHLGAERDVLLEPGRAVRAGEEPLVGVRPGPRDRVRRLRRIGGLRVEQLDDPARAVRVVECKLPLKAGADDRHIVAELTCSRGHGVEVEQASEQNMIGARGGFEDRPRPVRRREDDRARARRLEELPGRGSDIEAVDPNRVPLAAEDGVP